MKNKQYSTQLQMVPVCVPVPVPETFLGEEIHPGCFLWLKGTKIHHKGPRDALYNIRISRFTFGSPAASLLLPVCPHRQPYLPSQGKSVN